MTDLFIAKSKKEQIYDYILSKGRARTSEIIKFSSSIFCNTGDRIGRQLAEEGKIWRMSDRIKVLFPEYKESREEIWSVFEIDK